MTVEEAIRVLDPHTSRDAIEALRIEHGLSQEEIVSEIEKACVLACQALRLYQEGDLQC